MGSEDRDLAALVAQALDDAPLSPEQRDRLRRLIHQAYRLGATQHVRAYDERMAREREA